MDISWTIGIILLSLFYFIGSPILVLGLMVNGFMKSFTKYHIGGLFSLFILMIFGFLEMFLISLGVGMFLLLKNSEYLAKSYYTIRQTMQNLIKLIDINKKLTNSDIETSADLKNMEYVLNSLETNIRKVNSKYDSFRNYHVVRINNSILISDLCIVVKKIDIVLNVSFNAIKNNCKLITDELCKIYFVKKYINKIGTYYNSGNTLYFAYVTESDEIEKNINVETEKNINNGTQKFGNNIDSLEKINDLFGAMMGPIMQNKNFMNQIIDGQDDMSAMFDFISKMTEGKNDPHVSLKKKTKYKK
jgi:hypothetical protein